MLRKPDWLVGFLGSLTFTILSWTIDVGGPIEAAIDWLLEPVNSIIEWAGQVSAWWADFQSELVEFVNLVPVWINEVWQYLWNLAENYFQKVLDWWAAVADEVQSWIAAALDTAWEWIEAAGAVLREFVEARIAEVLGLLSDFVRLVDLSALIAAALAPFRNILDWWNAFAREIADFLADPWAWLYERLEEFIERYW